MESYFAIAPLVGLLLFIGGFAFLGCLVRPLPSDALTMSQKPQNVRVVAISMMVVGAAVSAVGVVGSIVLFPTIWVLPNYGW